MDATGFEWKITDWKHLDWSGEAGTRPRALKQLVGWSLIEVASLFGFCQVPTVSFMAWIRWNGCTNAVLLTTNKLYVMAPGGIP